MPLDLILDQLDRHRQRATYGAVAALTGRPATFLMAGRPRDWRHSWVVNQRTSTPTGYDTPEIHPDLHASSHVISSAQELADWLEQNAGLEIVRAKDETPARENNPWASLTTGELLSAYAGIMRALRSREVIRSSNNPVADLAENLAQRAFGLTLSEKSAKGYDGIDADGGRWQVKGRRQTPESRSTQLGVLRGLDEHRFDWLLAILFDETFAVVSAHRIPHAAVLDHALYSTTQKAHILHLKSRLLNDSRCVDVMLEVRAAAATYFKQAPRLAE